MALCAGRVETERAEEKEVRRPVGNSAVYPPGEVNVVLMLSGEPERGFSEALEGWSVITVRGARGVGLGTTLRYPCE